MKALPKRTKYIVTVTVNDPDILLRRWIKHYIKEAIEGWNGSYPAQHPLFNNIKKVSVK